MKIVILDSYAMNPGDLDWSSFQRFGEVKVYERSKPEEVITRSAGADILVVNKVKMTARVIESLPSLKMICVSATGYNVIDMEVAHRRGIVVTNAPDYSSQSVAQLVFAHLLNICNHTEHYAVSNRKGKWCTAPDFCYQDIPTVELAGKVMGIIGFGNIGSRVAQIALAFGMQVVAFTSKAQEQLPEGVLKVGLDSLLEMADVVSLHCPQTAETEQLINSRRLQQMKPSAILINTARGGLIDETAVAEALDSGKLKAYAADVLGEEPASASCPLLGKPNAFLTPHIAWATFEARQRLFRICEDNIEAFIEGHPVHVVS